MSTTERPLRADARRNREAILAAASELFARDGHAAQVDEVAARAGVGVGTVYRHFPTKAALVTEMVRVRFANFKEIARAAEAIDDPYAAIATVMRDSCAVVEHDVGFQVAMMGAAELQWTGIEQEKAAIDEAVSRIMRRGIEAGVLRADLSFDDWPMLMCGLVSTMYYAPSGGDWRRHVEIVLDGLRAR